MLGYRSEIDGLRAIAVLSVMLFHAGFSAVGGGYVGVDIFFVISGFLITNILVAENQAGTFSILNFYERRARRILPALYFVMLACFPVAYATMLPDELLRFARSVVATILFGSNLYFWQNTDYFDVDPESNPLLHTWSLAVEEQYYVLFPIALLLLWRLGLARVFLLIAVGTVMSLGLSEIGWRRAPSANFFLLPTRAWELGIGSLTSLALMRLRDWRIGPRVGEVAAGAGLIAIAASILLFDDTTPFPGLYALIPTLGTASIILFAVKGTMVAQLLSWRPLVFVGLISYSAYLWHQPVLVFARLHAGEIHWTGRLALVGLALGLAVVTWQFVERPFRNRRFLTRTRVFKASAAGSVMLFAAAGVFGMTQGFRDSYPPKMQQFVAVSLDARTAYIRSAYEAVRDADFTEESGKKLLLIGDSFTQDFYNMIVETGAFDGYQIAARYIRSRCQIYAGEEDVSRFIDPGYRSRCAAEANVDEMGDIIAEADVVVLSAEWLPWSARRLTATIESLDVRPDQSLVVIGRKNFGEIHPLDFFNVPSDSLGDVRQPPEAEQLAVNRIMHTDVDSEIFVDVHPMLCSPKTRCRLFTPEGALISHDGAHLTRRGAEYLGELMFQHPHLRRFGRGADRVL